ncbi:hypothetical protein BC826DRAFT_999508 [Russula brevipes]|nr:hypothetical protein BC826DRAFT_999508 [Russula brevipes]
MTMTSTGGTSMTNSLNHAASPQRRQCRPQTRDTRRVLKLATPQPTEESDNPRGLTLSRAPAHDIQPTAALEGTERGHPPQEPPPRNCQCDSGRRKTQMGQAIPDPTEHMKNQTPIQCSHRWQHHHQRRPLDRAKDTRHAPIKPRTPRSPLTTGALQTGPQR